jgi:predicted ATPase
VINKVVIKRFKRFKDVTFDLPGHIVLAGPNNTGKTTLLQAIAAWDLALNHWRKLNDFNSRNYGYTKAPIARQAFSAVPLRAFDLLWSDRGYDKRYSIRIDVYGDGWEIPMEIIADSTEQVYVRPYFTAAANVLRNARGWKIPKCVYVPPMTGLSTEEPVYQLPKLNQLLGQGKPGDIIRNLLVEAHNSQEAWKPLRDAIRRLFGYEILPPNSSGADIIVEYRADARSSRMDIASAGSGFQQVLMLLTFLHTRPASVLLIDEPDAHLHVILQDAIYSELRAVAQEKNSQLIIATHSEVIINSVELRELYVLFDKPRRLNDIAEKKRLAQSLGILTNTDIMLALKAPGVLYVEDYTDIDILREWAKILTHPSSELFDSGKLWKPKVSETRAGAQGIKAKDHYEALRLVREDIRGVELIDGDAHPDIQSTEFVEGKLQRLRWKRYEIESYLIHPAALERFVEQKVGPGTLSAQARSEMLASLTKMLSQDFVSAPLDEHPLVEAYLKQTKARESVLPPILDAAGLQGFPYTRYYEIAALMKPEEIHPEVIEKLDAIQKAFGL